MGPSPRILVPSLRDRPAERYEDRRDWPFPSEGYMGSGAICSQWSKDKPASGAGVLENLAGKLRRAVCKGVFMRGDERKE